MVLVVVLVWWFLLFGGGWVFWFLFERKKGRVWVKWEDNGGEFVFSRLTNKNDQKLRSGHLSPALLCCALLCSDPIRSGAFSQIIINLYMVKGNEYKKKKTFGGRKEAA